MPTPTIAVENNFVKGLITQASALNFPENACAETFDCIFNLNGTVERREAFKLEDQSTSKAIDRTDGAIASYLWKNAAGNGNVTLFVAQIGSTIYFWDATGLSISLGALSSTIDLNDYLADNAPNPSLIECQFSSGNKYLVVTHPYCQPFYVTYDTSAKTVSATGITLQVRDFQGDTTDINAISARPTSSLIDDAHHYNLLNQGWTATNLATWDSGRTDLPSNADVMWRFKNSSDAFDLTTIANVDTGLGQSTNTPAPKGHFILTVWNKDRNAASGLNNVLLENTSYQRPATSAFFGGRIFYSGLNYNGYQSDIYFSQILERDEQYGFCYQTEDPTSSDLSDLLASDGGVVRIPEAGTIIHLAAIAGALLVFANNGVWSVTGSTGLGFKADDYTIQKISSINAISYTSFVDVGGYPAWWNGDGIYTISVDTGAPVVKSLTLTTIKQFYDDIPIYCKLTAKGFYHPVEGIVQWLYKSTTSDNIIDTYNYDRVLNFNVITGAFYPWTIPTGSDMTINSLMVLPSSSGTLVVDNVVDGTGKQVVQTTGNDVVSIHFDGVGAIPPTKFLCSIPNLSNTYDVSFADATSETYYDWYSLDNTGVDYDSYFITGYKIRGQGLNKYQPTWINIFSDTETEVAYNFSGIWDYAAVPASNRFTSVQTITHSNLDFAVAIKRLKLRGHGKTLQFKVNSVAGKPFVIEGWSVLDNTNQIP